ncbi:hypothetical protein KKG22_03070, partial [Patescibacteria group bacterium]|nr:hypothetical protein [Patescibacteria group bacterium]MBU1721359.1 hypothetical protein [Patescibacteria group bacterium]
YYKIMTFFKKKISSKEMAIGLYHSTISNAIKADFRDHDDNIILTKKEQATMLAQYLYNLFENSKLDKSKLLVLTTYVTNNYKFEEDEDLMVYMAISLEEFKKIGMFFKGISVEIQEFLKKDFLFDKDFNPIQKNLVMAWYVEHRQIIDLAFRLGLKKFKVIDI